VPTEIKKKIGDIEGLKPNMDNINKDPKASQREESSMRRGKDERRTQYAYEAFACPAKSKLDRKTKANSWGGNCPREISRG